MSNYKTLFEALQYQPKLYTFDFEGYAYAQGQICKCYLKHIIQFMAVVKFETSIRSALGCFQLVSHYPIAIKAMSVPVEQSLTICYI
jgi:hypothetical protein